MNFYESIANNYDYIFPYNTAHLNYIKSCLNNDTKEKTILDIGCGTGNLTLELAKVSKMVYAIDLDDKMIEIAELIKK